MKVRKLNPDKDKLKNTPKLDQQQIITEILQLEEQVITKALEGAGITLNEETAPKVARIYEPGKIDEYTLAYDKQPLGILKRGWQGKKFVILFNPIKSKT